MSEEREGGGIARGFVAGDDGRAERAASDDSPPEDAMLASGQAGEPPQSPAAHAHRPEDLAADLGPGAPPLPMRAADTDELRERFREAARQVRALLQQHQLGILSEDDFRAALRRWMVLDLEDRWWMLGLNSGRWYCHIDGRWRLAEPPILLEEEVESPAAAEGALPRGDTGAGRALDLAAERTAAPAEAVPSLTRGLLAEASGLDTGWIDDRPRYELPPPGPLYQQARARQRAWRRRRFGWVLTMLLAGGFLLGMGLLLAILVTYNRIVDDYREAIEGLAHYAPAQSVRIVDREGTLIAELIHGEGGARQTLDSLDDISPYLLHAVVALENERFYEDPGWDLLAIGRAVAQNFLAGEITSGASTITQQLARLLILRDNSLSAERKLREIVVAAELARRYDKNDLLLLYLNEVNFGNQAYGVQAAAQLYFGVSARELNLPQAALLAGMLQAPAYYDPIRSEEGRVATMERTLTAIRQMVSVGCLRFAHGEWMDTEAAFCIGEDLLPQHPDYANYADADPLPALVVLDEMGILHDGLALPQFARLEMARYEAPPPQRRHPHVVDLVMQQVEAAYPGQMFARGFTIETTIDSELQEAAQAIITAGVRRHEQQGVTNGAALISDPQSGAVLAMVGSVDYADEERSGQVNNTIQFHQPGSTIKPLVYAAALEGVDKDDDGRVGAGEYLTASSILWDVPLDYENFSPRNFDGRFHGPVTLRTALQASYNIPVQRVYAFIGNERFMEFAQHLGLQFLPGSEFNLTSALGSNEVRMWDMNEAFAVFASAGRWRSLRLIARITDHRGQEVPLPGLAEERQAISPALAFLMQDILSDNPARAAAFGIDSALHLRWGGDDQRRLVAAKSGTTNGARDLWTIGFSDSAVVSVWLGDVDNAETRVMAASLTAAPLWNELMLETLAKRPPQAFQSPASGITERTVCTKTGTALAGASCPTQHREWFLAERPPPSASAGWLQEAAVDAWTGRLADEQCAERVRVQRFLRSEDPWVRSWLSDQAAGQAFAREQGLALPLATLPTEPCSADDPQPIVALHEPPPYSIVRGVVTLRGEVSEQRYDSVESYDLAVAPQGAAFTKLRDRAGQEQGPFTPPPLASGGLLGSWDTTNLPDGEYTLRLRARAKAEFGAGEWAVEVPVTVRNNG